MKTILLILSISILLTTNAFSNSNNLKECSYTMVDKLQTDQANTFNLFENLEQNFSKSCTWSEMYGLTQADICTNFKERFIAVGKLKEDFDFIFSELEKRHEEIEPFLLCKTEQRFTAKKLLDKNSVDMDGFIKYNNEYINNCITQLTKNIEILCSDKVNVYKANKQKTNNFNFQKEKDFSKINPFTKKVEKKVKFHLNDKTIEENGVSYKVLN